MLNKEKYAIEIIEFSLNGSGIAVIKNTNKVVKCNSLCNCKDCIFSTEYGDCSVKKIQEWANSEYKEPLLTNEEREYLSAVCKPFEIVGIEKYSEAYGNAVLVIRTKYDETIRLPLFARELFYTGMRLDKEYTPQELGVTCKNNRGNGND